MLDTVFALLSNVGYWLQVILAFSLLVVAHEFGHFIVAKWTGCRVDEFAVGFGPAIWQCKPKNSETLYAIRWIPLGGYNRIWGYEDTSTEEFINTPEEEKHRAFINRPIWARALVLVAGSAFNFILAILLVAGWGLVVGYPYTEIGEVVPNSPAAQAGIKSGDTVRNFGFASRPEDISTNIASQMLEPYDSTQSNVEDQAGAPVTLTTRSAEGQLASNTMVPVTNPETGKPMVGIIMREALGTRIEFVREDSIYNRSGLAKGDTIKTINGEPVESGFQIYKALEISPEKPATIIYDRDNQEQKVVITDYRVWNPGVMLWPAGVTSELKVAGVVPGSAADKIGLKTDDIITAINGHAVNRKSANWEQLVTLPSLPPLELTVRRAGQDGAMSKLITPDMVERAVDPGMAFNQLYLPVGPFQALKEGFQQTVYFTKVIWDSLGNLFAGQNKVSELAGPIGIFTTSFKAAKNGAFDLMILVVLLTINLGIFNLLPFPALDGGRLVFLALEGMFRKPVVDIRVENMIHVGGFLLLIGLMLYISYFDVARVRMG